MNHHSKNRLSSSLRRFGAACAVLLLSLGTSLRAGEVKDTTEFNVTFRLNSSVVEPSMFDNATRINNAVEFLNRVKNDPKLEIVNVAFCGAASPEGPYEINRALADKRLKAVEKIVRDQVEIPQSIVTYNHNYIPWNMLKREIAASNLAHKDEVLAIINGPSEMVSFPGGRTIDSRIPALQKLDGGSVWKELNSKFFSQMRMASAVIITVQEVPDPEPEPVVIPEP